MPRYLIFPVLTLALAIVPAGADTLSDWAQTCLDTSAGEHNLVGLTAAVAVDGNVVWTGASGFADRENKIACTPDTIHRIASISKAMTATAVMQLVAQDRIKLNEPLQTYVPDFPESKKGIVRIHHLLTHTSGIRHYNFGENRPMDHYSTLGEALVVFKDSRIPFEPGTNYRYTTYGYTTLGAVMEAASGQRYGDYMREQVWQPAGMTRTSLEVRGVNVDNKMKLYRYEDDAIVPDDETDLSIKYPGGGIQSTAGDLVRFAIAFENGTLLKPEHREMMFNAPEVRRRPFNYGYGWIYQDHDEFGRIIQHDGGQSGTTTNLMIFRDRKIAVAVLANIYGVAGQVRDITLDLAKKAIELKDAGQLGE